LIPRADWRRSPAFEEAVFMRTTCISSVLVASLLLLAVAVAGCGSSPSAIVNPPPTNQSQFAFLRWTVAVGAPQGAAVHPSAKHRPDARTLASRRAMGVAAAAGTIMDGPMDLYIMAVNGSLGSETKVSTTPGLYLNVDVDANGSKAVFTAVPSAGAGFDYLQVYVMDLATHVVSQLTTSNLDHWEAELSANGSQVVFDQYVADCDCYQLATISSSGGPVSLITPGDDQSLPLASMDVYAPTFAPDGSIVFTDDFTGYIYRVHGDGTGLTLLSDSGSDWFPSVSADGSKIVFERDIPTETGWSFEVWIMDSNGANQQFLAGDAMDPVFAGDRIMFGADYDLTGTLDIHIMNQDGTGVTHLTHNSLDDVFLWMPF